jgi:LysM repeat protein
MDSDGGGENQSQPWQRSMRAGSPLRQVRNSSILTAMLFAFGALLIVGYLSFSSSPTVSPTQTQTLQQALAPASPTVRPAVAEVGPREGPPSSTPTQEPVSTYRVIPGDTLTGIAAKLNVPVNQQAVWMDETMCLNGIVDADKLISGQELRLPTPGSQAVALTPVQKPLNAAPTQVSLRPTPRPPAPKTPSPTAAPRKTPSRPGTPTTTFTPRPATIQKSPIRQN